MPDLHTTVTQRHLLSLIHADEGAGMAGAAELARQVFVLTEQITELHTKLVRVHLDKLEARGMIRRSRTSAVGYELTPDGIDALMLYGMPTPRINLSSFCPAPGQTAGESAPIHAPADTLATKEHHDG